MIIIKIIIIIILNELKTLITLSSVVILCWVPLNLRAFNNALINLFR